MQLTTKLPWDTAQPRWASILNPILALPILNGNQIEQIRLTANVAKSINHLLQRMQQGWIVTDTSAASNIWRTKAFNDLTLTLESDADTIINIWVF